MYIVPDFQLRPLCGQIGVVGRLRYVRAIPFFRGKICVHVSIGAALQLAVYGRIMDV